MLLLVLALLQTPAVPRFLYEDPVADRLIRQAMSASYSLQLTEARTAATSLETRYPDHPAGFTLMAETYWWEAQTDPGNQSIEKEYYRRQELAVEKGEKALKLSKYPKIEVTSYLASAHGSYARFQVTQKEAFLGALRSGLKAHDYAEEVYKMDPKYYDIWVGLGAFNYFTAALPSYIKPFAYLIGVRGDKDLGLDQLRIAIERGRYAQTEGRIVLYTVFTEDKQYTASFRILERLMSDFKDNFALYVWVTDWYRRQGKNLEGADYFERMYASQIQRSPLMAGYALLEKARLQDAHARPADARQTLARLRSIPGISNPLLLSRAQALERTMAR